MSKRELYEETGEGILIIFVIVVNALLLFAKILSKNYGRESLLDKTKWFAFEFLGSDNEINIQPENINQSFVIGNGWLR